MTDINLKLRYWKSKNTVFVGERIYSEGLKQHVLSYYLEFNESATHLHFGSTISNPSEELLSKLIQVLNIAQALESVEYRKKVFASPQMLTSVWQVPMLAELKQNNL